MTTKPVLGISGCLTGSAVRFDGGHKRMGFVMDELAQQVMALIKKGNLSGQRPTIHVVVEAFKKRIELRLLEHQIGIHPFREAAGETGFAGPDRAFHNDIARFF